MKAAMWWLVALTVVACEENTGPGGVADAQLHIVQQDTLAPPLVASRDSFWAKVGDGRELRLFYQGATPTDSGGEFLRFEVADDGLLRKPDGTAFQPGDSILITVTVVDASRFLFDFEPAGLVFDASHPARLRVRYYNCERDFNGDGVVDSTDASIEGEIDLWYRATPGALWVRTGGVKFEDLDEIDVNVRTFSQYALAW